MWKLVTFLAGNYVSWVIFTDKGKELTNKAGYFVINEGKKLYKQLINNETETDIEEIEPERKGA